MNAFFILAMGQQFSGQQKADQKIAR